MYTSPIHFTESFNAKVMRTKKFCATELMFGLVEHGFSLVEHGGGVESEFSNRFGNSLALAKPNNYHIVIFKLHSQAKSKYTFATLF
jgi:hypothetical protein